jgi:hypothetical protein
MRIVKVEHERCGDLEETVYYVIPEHLEGDAVYDAVHAAVDSYLKAREEAQALNPLPSPVSRYIQDIADETMTIGEAKAMFSAYEQARAQRDAVTRKVSGSFETHLKSLGFIPLWAYKGDDLMTSSAYWGHKHGQKLDYK